MAKLSAKPVAGSIAGAAVQLATGDITAVALVEGIYSRYEEVDDEVKGYLQINKEKALVAAAESDARRAAGNTLSAYDGVPIAIKDNISVDGETCGCASKLLEGYTATYDATVVQKLKAQGFIPMGRTNMDEFAMGSSTENSAYQQTRNPANTDHVPGGSSGGSAAVVAAGEAIAALGSDTGGSIRQPAGFCGVVGLKPTYGRVSRFGLVAFASSLDQIGPVTHTVEDAAILLDMIAGKDQLDSTSIPDVECNLAASLKGADVKGMKVGLPKEFFEIDVLNDEVKAKVEAVRDQLEAAGAELVEVSLPNLEYAVSVYYVIATAEASSNLSRFDGIRYGARVEKTKDVKDIYYLTREAGFGDEVKRRIILGTYVLSSGYYDAYYLRAQKARTLIRQDFEAAFEQCDVILGPIAPAPAFKLGEISDPLQMYLSDIYTISVNLAGNCAISVPAGETESGLPVGVQFIGDSLQEEKILKAAQFVEQQQAQQGD
ncbi:MAG: Asp-tRNA(Asn)/Glu-tRNA(Gln) amidotransferase subunit GatA [Lentisphaeria bacterium]|nr:Asp-tRNA(Asn)/Glu-tRNA(Gln) amidotransferase subunit GatA [Lentisphaeria bacterium]